MRIVKKGKDIPTACTCTFMEACTLEGCRTTGDLHYSVVELARELEQEYLKISYDRTPI